MRSFAILTALVLAVGMLGCGSAEQPPEPVSDQPVPTDSGQIIDTLAGEAEAVEPEAMPDTMAAAEPEKMLEPEAEPEAKPERQLTPKQAEGPLPTLYDFYATWCPPCQDQKPIVAELEKEYEGKVRIQTIDVDENQEIAAKYDVKAIPTLVFLDREGNEADRFVGLSDKAKIVGKFKELGFIE